ncbi:MAG: hypothetical protein JW795_02810 [Chitinivibrionales bacterium]|nr:hypothetical protein [Chitinivibrionales bacterium]
MIKKPIFYILVVAGIICVIKSFMTSDMFINAVIKPPDAVASIIQPIALSSTGVIAVVSGLSGLLVGLKQRSV